MILRLCAVGLLVSFIGFILSEYGWRGKKLFGILSAVIILSVLGESVLTIFGEVTRLSDLAGISEVAQVALKVVGVGYVFGFCSEVARELGEGAVASALALAGRVETLLLVLPYFKQILKLGAELIK